MIKVRVKHKLSKHILEAELQHSYDLSHILSETDISTANSKQVPDLFLPNENDAEILKSFKIKCAELYNTADNMKDTSILDSSIISNDSSIVDNAEKILDTVLRLNSLYQMF